MNLKIVWIVFRKEILDILRDRRTLIFMILLPLLLMPALISIMSSFQISSMKKIATSDSRVAIIGAEDAPGIVNWIEAAERTKLTPPEGDNDLDAFVIEEQSGVNAFIAVDKEVTDLAAAQALVREKKLDAILVIPQGFESQLAPRTEEGVDPYTAGLSLRIEFASTDERSEKGYNRLRKSLERYRTQIVNERLATAGYSESLVKPWENNASDLATVQERGGMILGSMLPYIIILMVFSGATFPAISLAAGEKEQKTLETLLVSPAGRADLIAGKFLTIMVTGIISGGLALVGMYYGMTQMGGGVSRLREFLTLQLDATSIVMVVLLIIPLTLVFAGVLLALSVVARSYREAQGYIGPLNMLVILPAFASFIPGVELNWWLAMAPIVNVSLVMRQILAGKAMEVMGYFAITVLSTFVLAALAIWFCAWMFRKESAIFKL